MPPCGKNMCGYSRPCDIPGIRKGLKAMWLPAPRCAELRCALLVEVMIAADSDPSALQTDSPASFSSGLLSLLTSLEQEEVVLLLSAALVKDGLVPSDVDGVVVVGALEADNEEEELA